MVSSCTRLVLLVQSICAACAVYANDGKGLMLLQIGQEKKKALPEVAEVLSKPKNVFQALSSQVNSLQAHLEEVQEEGTAAMKVQKAEYEMKLENQRRNNTALAQEQEHLRAHP